MIYTKYKMNCWCYAILLSVQFSLSLSPPPQPHSVPPSPKGSIPPGLQHINISVREKATTWPTLRRLERIKMIACGWDYRSLSFHIKCLLAYFLSSSLVCLLLDSRSSTVVISRVNSRHSLRSFSSFICHHRLFLFGFGLSRSLREPFPFQLEYEIFVCRKTRETCRGSAWDLCEIWGCWVIIRRHSHTLAPCSLHSSLPSPSNHIPITWLNRWEKKLHRLSTTRTSWTLKSSRRGWVRGFSAEKEEMDGAAGMWKMRNEARNEEMNYYKN